MQIGSPVLAIGSVTTAGDEILKTDQLRSITSAGGVGINVGVISKGVTHLADAQKTGDLPPDVHVLKQGRQDDEGTAMLEIIHDMAPNASLYYDFGDTEQKFNTAVDSLIAAGCNIIVDDVGMLEIPYFEDGIVAKHLEEVLSDNPNLLYISSAGNNAEYHYQGMFIDGGDNFHSFNGSTGIPLDIKPGGWVGVILQWDDPYEQRDNAYSLYLYDRETGSEIAVSERTASGEKRAFEMFKYQYLGTDKPAKTEVRIRKADDSDPKLLELVLKTDANLVSMPEGYTIPTDSIIGQAAANQVITVAAVSAVQKQILQKFSSQGEVTISHPSAELRKKPDITAVDNVEVSGAGGFVSPFPGTSAAAPHIAGLLALEWSLFPGLTGEQLKEAMFQTATGFGEPGWNRMYGYGLPDAVRMYEYLQNTTAGNITVKPTPTITPTITPTVTPTPEPGDLITSQISDAVIITKPGTYYLNADIMDSSDSIIVIASSDVVLEGNNHQIEGFTVQFGLQPIALQRGVEIASPDGSRLSNITVRNLAVMGTYVGIIARHCDKITIENCRLPYNSIGLLLSDISQSDISGCVMNGNSYSGLIMDQGSKDNRIQMNDIRKNLIGMILDGVEKILISKNSVTFNHHEGFLLKGGSNTNQIEHNICSENGNGGIVLKSSLKNWIVNNTCEQNTPPGIYLEESSENIITDNRLSGNVRGINLYYADTNTLSNNSIVNNRATGIMFQPSGHNIVNRNFIVGNEGEGILISSGVTSEKVNLITDNYLENEDNVWVQEGGKPNYQWSDQKKPGTNIIGGSYLAGNVWALADGKGYSQTCMDNDGDGICDQPYMFLPGLTDEAPLHYTGVVASKPSSQSNPPVARPLNAEDLVTEGLTLFGKGDYVGAIAQMDKAITLSPTKFQAWRVKALALSKLKKSDESITTLNQALQLYPESLILWYTLGDIYLLDLEDYAKAIPAYSNALKIDPNDTHSLANLAFALDKTGKSEEALDLYLKAVTVNPSLTDAWVKAGNIETRAKHYDQAILYYEKALTLDPGNAFTWNNKGYTLSLMGSFDEAIKAYQNAIRIDNTYGVAWTNLGNAYRAMGDENAAQEAYSHA
jgi:parallel beta-helix repeat protein